MSLKETLMQDLKTAMKTKDKRAKDTITMVRAAIKQKEVDERVELDDEGVLKVLSKEIKERRGSIEEFEKAGRDDLVESTKAEIDVLMKYMPEQLSEEELEKLIRQVMEENNITEKKQMGLLMKNIMPKVQGRADGKAVNAIVNRILN
ncbi:GatB/YqeY domain-containing protein [Aedoeadaptatus acetigenes]|uniref:GatB/YqeY domain-containing protein n=1 Tax=Aedoeadaptatus acetigenes TaxID=2981723 RepID=A0ABV1J646_9FIRM|nr:GatB/YqeY domain-containing protein [Aedoeadaptatus acetigenes]MBS6524657.1 GatB/YqeY domain-containing protein [Peptoniphilaceae bacterium]MCU6787195.1 GatB/YqeY domain-containing protein [Aedoeadaptatus acetigenes]